MILIVDDQKLPRQQIVDALCLMGVLPAEIQQASRYIEACNLLEQTISSGALPIVIVDYDLNDPLGNGRMLLIDKAFPFAAKHTGGHVWAVFYSRHGRQVIDQYIESRYEFPRIQRVTEDPSKHWAKECARIVAPLLSSQPNTDDGFLSPTYPIQAGDRIFLYSSGRARKACLRGPAIEDVFPAATIPAQLESCKDAILMFRGRFVPLSSIRASTSLVRLLLRWRTLASRTRSEFLMKRLFSFTHGAINSKKSFPPKFGRALISGLRNDQVVKQICQFLNFSDHHIPTIPQFEERQNTKMPCPPEFNDIVSKDGFFARLHFVLSDAELGNFNQWLKDIGVNV